jgi:hypothetical protein
MRQVTARISLDAGLILATVICGVVLAVSASPTATLAQVAGYGINGHACCYSTPYEAAVAVTFADYGGTTLGYVQTSPGYYEVFFTEGIKSSPFYYYCPPNSTTGPMPATGCPGGPPIPTNCDCNGNSNNTATPSPSTTNPIDILSGNEQLSATDFANANGSLVLRRLHNSAAQSGLVTWRATLAMAPLANPVGLGNWQYDFQFELHITGAAPTSPVALFAPNGSAPAFAQNSASPSSLTLVNYYGTGTTAVPPNPQTDYTLAIVG